MLFVITEKSKNNKIIKKLSGFVEEFDIVFAETVKELSYYNVVQSTDAILIANDEKMNKKTLKDLPKGVKVLTLTADSLGEELDLSQLFIQLTGKPRLGAFLGEPETLLYRPCPICSCFAHKDDFLEKENDESDLEIKVGNENKSNTVSKSDDKASITETDKELSKDKPLVKNNVADMDNKPRSEKQGNQRKQNKYGKDSTQFKSSDQRFSQKKVSNRKTGEVENNGNSLKENNFNKTKNESRDNAFTIKNRNKKEDFDKKDKAISKKVVKEFKPINEIKNVESKPHKPEKNSQIKDEPFELLEDFDSNKTTKNSEEIMNHNNFDNLVSETPVENNNDMPFELEPEDERLDPISVIERKSSENKEENNEISFNRDEFEQLLSGVS